MRSGRSRIEENPDQPLERFGRDLRRVSASVFRSGSLNFHIRNEVGDIDILCGDGTVDLLDLGDELDGVSHLGGVDGAQTVLARIACHDQRQRGVPLLADDRAAGLGIILDKIVRCLVRILDGPGIALHRCGDEALQDVRPLRDRLVTCHDAQRIIVDVEIGKHESPHLQAGLLRGRLDRRCLVDEADN